MEELEEGRKNREKRKKKLGRGRRKKGREREETRNKAEEEGLYACPDCGVPRRGPIGSTHWGELSRVLHTGTGLSSGLTVGAKQLAVCTQFLGLCSKDSLLGSFVYSAVEICI